MTLMDELLAPQTYACKVCTWLATLTPAQQAEWDEALRNPRVKDAAVLKIARRRGFTGSSHEPVNRHRKDGHRVKS